MQTLLIIFTACLVNMMLYLSYSHAAYLLMKITRQPSFVPILAQVSDVVINDDIEDLSKDRDEA